MQSSICANTWPVNCRSSAAISCSICANPLRLNYGHGGRKKAGDVPAFTHISREIALTRLASLGGFFAFSAELFAHFSVQFLLIGLHRTFFSLGRLRCHSFCGFDGLRCFFRRGHRRRWLGGSRRSGWRGRGCRRGGSWSLGERHAVAEQCCNAERTDVCSQFFHDDFISERVNETRIIAANRDCAPCCAQTDTR